MSGITTITLNELKEQINNYDENTDYVITVSFNELKEVNEDETSS